MKIAVTSNGNSKNSKISERFARSPFIVVYDTDTNDYSAIENTGSQNKNGAGPRTAELLINNKVDVLLTMELGVKAYSVLAKGNIKVELLHSGFIVSAAIKKFLEHNR